MGSYTTVDEADGNFAVICKKNYVLTLMKEFGSRENHTYVPKIYETCDDKANNNLINSHGKLF